MPSEVNVAMMRPLKGPVGNRGFFALVTVVLSQDLEYLVLNQDSMKLFCLSRVVVILTSSMKEELDQL